MGNISKNYFFNFLLNIWEITQKFIGVQSIHLIFIIVKTKKVYTNNYPVKQIADLKF